MICAGAKHEKREVPKEHEGVRRCSKTKQNTKQIKIGK